MISSIIVLIFCLFFISIFNSAWGGGCIPALHYSSFGGTQLIRGFAKTFNTEINHVKDYALAKVATKCITNVYKHSNIE